MTVAVVIPAFNESRSVAAMVAALKNSGTVIVVDDGSVDDTDAQAAAAGAMVVRHDRNRGYDAALASGFARAENLGADTIVTIDADGQLGADTVPLALAALADGYTRLVIGTRSTGPARWSEALFNLYTRLRFGVPDILCGLKAFRMEDYVSHRHQLARRSVNTALALALMRSQAPLRLVDVATVPRHEQSRFGDGWRGNARILRALGRALLDDALGR